MNDEGLFTLAMIKKLVEIQNGFVRYYESCDVAMIVKDEECSNDEKSKEIPLQLVGKEQLIAFYDNDIERECRLVVEQSLEYSKGDENEFDFDRLENNLIFKYLAGKPLIVFQASIFNFSDDVKGDSREELEKKIPQQELPNLVKKKIKKEIPSYLIRPILRNLEMCIKFLQHTGGTGSTLLSRYLQEVLKLETDQQLLQGTISKEVKLLHVYSLYVLLVEQQGDEFQDIKNQKPLEVWN